MAAGAMAVAVGMAINLIYWFLLVREVGKALAEFGQRYPWLLISLTTAFLTALLIDDKLMQFVRQEAAAANPDADSD